MARHEHDFYRTPEWVTRALLRLHAVGPQVLEPCAGDGAIVRVIKEHRPAAYVTAVELRDEGANLRAAGADQVITGLDLLDRTVWPWGYPRCDTIITNPPFKLAQQVVERCLEIADGRAEVWMLMRLRMLATDDRSLWWQDKLPNRLYVITPRPSFTGKGNDYAEYAWYGWIPGCTDQQIRVLRREG